jgi:nicotinamidase-related amidase|tara:strand:- start:998 stop:1582 length:585 start_codon:yes stop_codon:yes gene_type:complete
MVNKNKAIMVMDYINEIIHPDGKFKAKGYADFAKNNDTIKNVIDAVEYARNEGMKIIYVKVGFSENYVDQPKESPLFGKANEFQALKLNTWATEFHEDLEIREEDEVIIKHRVSPFYNTGLESYLEKNKIDELYLCGVSTDLVVQSAARDGHDRDYKINVLSDCCAAGSIGDHKNSLKTLEKIAKVGNYKEFFS